MERTESEQARSRPGSQRIHRRFSLAGRRLMLGLVPWLAVLSILGVVSCSRKQATPNERVKAPKSDLFTSASVVRIRIEISPAGMDTLRRTHWRGLQERPTAQATVWEGKVAYTNVAIHVKGAAGSFRPIDDNPALTLNFQKYAPGQSFHGLHKLSLNNSVQDPSFLTEQICRELFAAAGVPVPRATHAAVELNGRNLGLRVLVEGFNKQFLKRHFKDTRGNLYDGGFVQDINGRLAVNSGENPQDRSGLQALINAVQERWPNLLPDFPRRRGSYAGLQIVRTQDETRAFARLEQVLDMDRFISLLAMDIIECNWDGYAMNRNNWRIFHDRESNKMVFMPHGLDQMFGVVRARPDMQILPPMQGAVALAVLFTPEGHRRYLERLMELYTDVFHVDELLRRVDELAAVIGPVIAESGSGKARAHDRAVQLLKQRIVQRDQSLRRQLAVLAVQLETNPQQSPSRTGGR